MVENLEFSAEKSRMDASLIQAFLSKTYWASGRTLEHVQRSIENSRCYGAFHDGKQIAFARVVTDCVAFAYLMDVFVLPDFRGQRVATRLLQYLLADPDLADIPVWQLKTSDAHPLYRRLGFEPIKDPENLMRLQRNLPIQSQPEA